MSGGEFILVGSSLSKIPGMLLAEVEGFSVSEEYARLDDEDRQSPGIVCGALANYVSRVWADSGSEPVLSSAFRIVESLSAVEDVEIQNLVVTELLENINFTDYPDLIQLMGPKSRALYDRWLATPPGTLR